MILDFRKLLKRRSVRGEKELLRRMVLQIRLLRPMHHHQSRHDERSWSSPGNRPTVLQAFDAAADPKQFPEQLAQTECGKCNDSSCALVVRPKRTGPQAPPQVVTIDPNEPIRLRRHVRAPSPRRTTKTCDARPMAQDCPSRRCRIIRYSLVRQAPIGTCLFRLTLKLWLMD